MKLVVKNTFLEVQDVSRSSSKASSDPTPTPANASITSGSSSSLLSKEEVGHAAATSQDNSGSSARNNLHKVWGGLEPDRSLSLMSGEVPQGVVMTSSSDTKSQSQVASSLSSKALDGTLQAAAGATPAAAGEVDPAWTGYESKGSELHAQGTCRPCFFMASKSNCMNGTGCNFCHMPHESAERLRPCKSKRARAKRIAEQLEKSCTSACEIEAAAEMLETREAYLKSVLQSRARSWLETKHDAASSSKCDGAKRIIMSI